MPRATDLKRGMVIDINGVPHVIKHYEAKSPMSRGGVTMYKVRYTNMQTGQKVEEAYKGEELLKEADCVKVPVTFSYLDGDNYVFMNSEDYSQYEVSAQEIEDQVGYITESLEGIVAILMDGRLLSIELPQHVELEVIETVPGMKGASATNRTKPAKLSTGLEIQVPEYLEQGEVIKVNTVTGKFSSRA